MNLRGKLWKILCKTDVIIEEMLEEYNRTLDKVGPAFKQSVVENKKMNTKKRSQQRHKERGYRRLLQV